MNVTLLYSLAYLAGAMICFSIWRKHRDRDWLWFTCLAIIGGGLEIAHYLVTILEAPSSIISISDTAILLFAPIEVAVLAWVAYRLLVKKKGDGV